MPKRLGIITSPMVFGDSRSFRAHVSAMRALDYPVRVLGLYQDYRRPLPIPPIPPSRPDRLALALNARREELLDRAERMADSLLRQGCDKVAFVGFGYGAVLGLWYAERRPLPVVGWYPHLFFPETVQNAPPPDLTKITSPVQLFYGRRDKVIPSSVAKAEILSLDRDYPNLGVTVIPGVGHAFVDWTIAGFTPNPLYRRRAAHVSWNVALRFLRNV